MSASYMQEYQLFDGEAWITFDIINLDQKRNTVMLAVTNRGKISVLEYDLFSNDKGLYFEYGPLYSKIYIEDFEEVSVNGECY